MARPRTISRVSRLFQRMKELESSNGRIWKLWHVGENMFQLLSEAVFLVFEYSVL